MLIYTDETDINKLSVVSESVLSNWCRQLTADSLTTNKLSNFIGTNILCQKDNFPVFSTLYDRLLIYLIKNIYCCQPR